MEEIQTVMSDACGAFAEHTIKAGLREKYLAKFAI